MSLGAGITAGQRPWTRQVHSWGVVLQGATLPARGAPQGRPLRASTESRCLHIRSIHLVVASNSDALDQRRQRADLRVSLVLATRPYLDQHLIRAGQQGFSWTRSPPLLRNSGVRFEAHTPPFRLAMLRLSLVACRPGLGLGCGSTGYRCLCPCEATSDKTSDERQVRVCRACAGRAGFVGGHRRSEGHQRRWESTR